MAHGVGSARLVPSSWLPGASRPLFGSLALAALLGLAAGCNTAGTGVQPPQAFEVPEWKDLNIQSLAFLGVGSSAGDQATRDEVQKIVEQQLTSGQDRFIILPLAESRSRAASSKASDVCGSIEQMWKDDRKLDLFQVKEFCHKIGVDGIMVADLNDWNQQKVDWNAEGTSFTQVGLRLSIYSGKTGLLAWDAEKIQRKESRPYRPSPSGTGVYQDPTGAKRAEHPENLTPDAPPPEDVAVEAIQSLMAAFPPKPTAG